MDRDQNRMKDDAKKTRLKRKSLLRDKGATFPRAMNRQRIQQNMQHNNLTQRPTNFSPLSDITNRSLNDNNQVHCQYIQPSTSQQPFQKQGRSIHIGGLGVNLMSKFANIHPNSVDQRDENSSYNMAASSSNTNFAGTSSSTRLSPNHHLYRGNADDSSEDEDDVATFGVPTAEEFTSDSNSSSDEEDYQFNANNVEPTNLNQGYSDIGDPLIECEFCGAYMWYRERIRKHRDTTIPKFELCCGKGRVQLPFLTTPPPLLQHLLFDNYSPDSKNYQEHIRIYNMMFAFTSPGAKLDRSINDGRGPPNIRIHGQPCHRIGSMLPMPGQTPKFAQLYIYDTENEIQNRIQGLRYHNNIDPQIVSKLSAMLDGYNTHAKSFRMARERLRNATVPNLKLKLISERSTDGRVSNLPSVSEVAALIVGDVDSASKRDIIMEKMNGELQRIDELHASYLAYQYPLLFPYAEDGYRHDISHRSRSNNQRKRNRLTVREWISFRIQTRKEEAQTLLRSRRLFQQFLVDAYSMLESDRLSFIRRNQSKLRVDKYNSLNTSESDAQTQGSNKGKRVILPSTYVGSRRYMDQLYFDGMAICSYVGFPDLFITFTCNPNWPEIQRLLSPIHLTAQDRPDIVSRIFKMKFDELLSDLRTKHVLGKVLAYMYTIEFQKRGLPHAHLLIFLHPSSKYPTPNDIDKIISAEIPDQENQKDLYDLVKTHMIHGPCGRAKRSAPCMKDGKCSKFYPKKYQNTTIVDQDGYPVYRRRDSGNTIVMRNGISVDNRSVVPYNPYLLLKYRAHINMEWCNQSTSIKYLFKYINKGYDRITAVIEPSEDQASANRQNIDEIKQYLDCRYISPSEACWRIFKFPIHARKPAVERLFFHLPGEQAVYFNDWQDIDDVLSKPTVKESMFTSWLQTNQTFPQAKNLTYAQFASKFVYVKGRRTWKPRKGGYTIGRLIWVPPCIGELFYLRMMLTVVKGPASYEDIRTVGGIQHSTFREACFAMGLLEDDREYIQAIQEAKDWGSGHYLRKLFVTMLLTSTINRPEEVWYQSWQWLSDGILYEQRRLSNNKDLQLSNEEIQNLTLLEIEKLLQANRRTLKEFPSIPYPKGYVTRNLGNRLIYEERDYDTVELHHQFQCLFDSLTDEQRSIFDTIMQAVNRQQGRIFFLYGYGGTGKTFMWKTLASALRSQGHIVLTVASSGIASLLLPGGRTAHSKFKIPVPTVENSTCNIHQGTELAELLKLAKLIIWDEAPMAHKFCLEALDKSLRDIMGNDNPFGGKVIVFGGDFRQILPVVPRGSRSDIVHATINASYLWDNCQVLRLTKNMRLQQGLNNSSTAELEEFSEWILKVGDGKLSEPNDGYAEIEIPEEFLITDFNDPIHAIVQSTYPNLGQQYKNEEFLQARAILASTIETVDQINEYVLTLIPGDEKEFLSSDTLDKSEANGTQPYETLTPEFLSSLRTSGLPNHRIKLKIGTPIMLLRNLDQSEGLCNGTRLIVTRLGDHVIEAKIISGKNIGSTFYIPRMSMSPSQSPWPFKLIRKQFPIIISYAMTINKSQGQSLSSVGLYLPRPVFSHGQLYVAISRVQSKQGLKILIHDNEERPLKTTTNVVFKEVFQNLN